MSLLQVGNDPKTLYFYGVMLCLGSTFWIFASIFSFFDLVGAPYFMQNYKVQPGVNEPVDRAKFRHMMKAVIFNSFVTSPIYFYLHYRAMLWRGFPDVRILPEFHVALFEFAFFLLIEEIGFFYSHWLLHHKSVRTIVFTMVIDHK